MGPRLTTRLLPHQQRVLARLRGQPGLVVAHGLGSGKTLTSIAAGLSSGKATHVLAPASLVHNYHKELAKHVRGESSFDVRTHRNATMHGVPDAHTLVVDEAHRLREPGTKFHQAVASSKAKKRILLTASPTYNRPSDIAGPVNIAAGRKVLPTGDAFDQRYVRHPSASWLKRMNPENRRTHLVNKGSLSGKLHKWVDYHESGGGDFPSRTDKHVSVPMTTRQSHLHAMAWGKLPNRVKRTLKYGIPAKKGDIASINAFQSQARQIANSERGFFVNPQSPKIEHSVRRIQRSLAANPKHKAVVYSNYHDSLADHSERLTRAKIPHAMYTGKTSKRDRRTAVEDYNTGKIKALLVSSAGGEGLDLKGTRQVHVLEPHWNTEKLKQVIGRSIRHGSHAHLPKAQRNVDVVHYQAHPMSKNHWYRKSKREHGIDQILGDTSDRKEKLNQELRTILRRNEAARKLKKG